MGMLISVQRFKVKSVIFMSKIDFLEQNFSNLRSYKKIAGKKLFLILINFNLSCNSTVVVGFQKLYTIKVMTADMFRK